MRGKSNGGEEVYYTRTGRPASSQTKISASKKRKQMENEASEKEEKSYLEDEYSETPSEEGDDSDLDFNYAKEFAVTGKASDDDDGGRRTDDDDEDEYGVFRDKKVSSLQKDRRLVTFQVPVGSHSGTPKKGSEFVSPLVTPVRNPVMAAQEQQDIFYQQLDKYTKQHGQLNMLQPSTSTTMPPPPRRPEPTATTKILDALATDWMTEREVLDMLGNNQYIRVLVRSLLSQGLIIREGHGGNASPFRYKSLSTCGQVPIEVCFHSDDGECKQAREGGEETTGILKPDPVNEGRMQRIGRKILECLQKSSTQLAEKDIREAVGDNTGSGIGKAIRAMVASGHVVRMGRGGNKEPFTFMSSGKELPPAKAKRHRRISALKTSKPIFSIEEVHLELFPIDSVPRVPSPSPFAVLFQYCVPNPPPKSPVRNPLQTVETLLAANLPNLFNETTLEPGDVESIPLVLTIADTGNQDVESLFVPDTLVSSSTKSFQNFTIYTQAIQ